jgi:holo-[acyl-carrier protein] synthase
MIKGIGVDIVEINRVEKAVNDFGNRFLKRIFSEHEVNYCRRRKKLRIPELAVRFAAKEAFGKALGTGLNGLVWTEIEIRNDKLGKPILYHKGRAKPKTNVSLSHDGKFAVAFIVIEE